MFMLTIIDLVYLAVIMAFLYYTTIIAIRIDTNIRIDKMLNIKTRGTRSWGRGSLYNRAESTPYLALNGFVKEYKMDDKDSLVDFGCGKGRVAIYMHDAYKIPVTGVELNDETYQDVIDNVKSYVGDNEAKGHGLTIEKVMAESYEIKDEENKFFFFNPFHVDIFRKVVVNIIRHANKTRQDVEIILYYPIKDYKEFLNEKTQFKLVKEIKAEGSIGPREKFHIYKYKI